MRYTVLITGCNRGLGLEFVRQYAQAGWRVFATCRNPEQAIVLNRIASASQQHVTVHRLDIANRKQIKEVVSAIGETPIDLLLNNAGIDGQRNAQFGATDEARWLEAFRSQEVQFFTELAPSDIGCTAWRWWDHLLSFSHLAGTPSTYCIRDISGGPWFYPPFQGYIYLAIVAYCVRLVWRISSTWSQLRGSAR